VAEKLSDIYCERFFRRRAGYRGAYHRFAKAIWEIWQPASIADLGCGAGYLLEWFAERIPAVGVEGSEGALQVQSELARRHTTLADLTGPPLEAMRWIEFVVSIEVAEHIEPEHEDAFLRWFTWADRVFFTAAPPGQRGLHHVNTKPKEHWIERFGRMGLQYNEDETGKWVRRTRGTGCPWVRRNAMFFERVHR